jgi:hypothetical protein
LIHGSQTRKHTHGEVTGSAFDSGPNQVGRQHTVKALAEDLKVTNEGSKVSWIMLDEKVESFAVKGHSFFA